MECVRFVIVSILPEPVLSEIRKLQEVLSGIGHTFETMSYPPHITLRTGTIVPKKEIKGFIDEFGEAIGTRSCIDIKTGKLEKSEYEHGCMKKFMISFQVKRTDDLMLLNRDTLVYEKYRKSDKKNFSPHISLAYDDLSPEGYEKICEYIDAHPEYFDRTFDFALDNVSLLNRIDGTWKTMHAYILNSRKIIEEKYHDAYRTV